MNEQNFFAKREKDWRRLNELCAMADISPTQLRPSEIREMFRLYRRVSADLALARTKSLNTQFIGFLNDLTARCYSTLYRRRRTRWAEAFRRSILVAAQTVRRRAVFVALSLLLFVGSAGYADFCLTKFPDTRARFIPIQAEQNFESWKTGEFDAQSFTEGVAGTGFYLSNNPRVSIIAASISASTFGFGTAYLMFQNGAMIGSLIHELRPVNRIGYLFTRIVPHGIPEISGIIVSGAAGLYMGYALINPGRKRRGQALLEAGKDGVVLLITSVVLMFIAAPIEGFFSFNAAIPDGFKILFSIVSGTAWAAFWFGYGRHEDQIQVEL